MQVSWSPIASCRRAAVTAELTPPERPQTTRPPPTLVADARDRLGAEGRHRPRAGAAADMLREVAQQPAALRRVRDLRVKHDAVEMARVVGDRGKGGALARRHRAETRRQRVDPVAVAHPHLLAPAALGRWGPQPVEQKALPDDVDEGAAELLVVAEA